MGQWDVFTTIYDAIATVVIAWVDVTAAALGAYVAPIARAALVALLAGTALVGAVHPRPGLLGEIWLKLLLGVVVIAVVSSAAVYGTWIRDGVLGFSREVAAALGGVTGGRPIAGTLFMEIWNKAFGTGLAVYRALPWSLSAIPLRMLVVAYWAVAFAAIAFAFFLWMRSFIFVSLLLGLGPLFLAMVPFPVVRSFARGWTHTVAAAVVFQILCAALLSLLIGAQSQVLAQIAAQVRPGGNEILALMGVLVGMVLLGGSAWLVYELNGMANSIGHGFSGHATQIGRNIAAGWMPGGGGGQPRQGGGGGRQGGHAPGGPAGPASPATSPARTRAAPGASLSGP